VGAAKAWLDDTPVEVLILFHNLGKVTAWKPGFTSEQALLVTKWSDERAEKRGKTCCRMEIRASTKYLRH